MAAALSAPIAVCFRLIPYAHRVRAATMLAAPMSLVARAIGGRTALNGQTVRERALGRLLSMLHYRAVAFPPNVSVEGDIVPAGPMLVLLRHSLLNQLLISRLVRDGLPVSVVLSGSSGVFRAFGGDQLVDIVEPTGMVLRAMTNRLRAGRIVFVAVDATAPSAGYLAVQTSAGPWFVATQPIRLAIKLKVPVAVVVHDIGATTVVSRIRRLASTDAEGIIAGYCDAYGLPVAGPCEEDAIAE